MMFGHQDDDNDQPAQSVVEPSTPSEPTTQDWGHPGTPIANDQPAEDVISPAGGYPESHAFPQTNHEQPKPDQEPAEESPADMGDLANIKQHALNELAPLLNNLDLSAEEKFRTIMMVIQSNDDQGLISEAYKAAHNIEDDKARARALLDVVNEVNYFTHQPPVGN